MDRDESAVDRILGGWRQGDVALDAEIEFMHAADPAAPLTPASRAVSVDGETGVIPILEEVPGVAVLTQTCDIVRPCANRPFVEVAPVVVQPAEFVDQVRHQKRPAFAYIPGVAHKRLVADLDRVMTVEKTIVASWTRIPGCRTDGEVRDFAAALARKSSRFAFPDDFVAASKRLLSRLAEKHDRRSEEGSHLRALREIRVGAAPSWNHGAVQTNWWFIREEEPDGIPAWDSMANKWVGLFDASGRFRVESAIACRLDDMTARDYVESDVLDLDRLSA